MVLYFRFRRWHGLGHEYNHKLLSVTSPRRLAACIYLISIDGPQFIVDLDGNSLNLCLSDKKSGKLIDLLRMYKS